MLNEIANFGMAQLAVQRNLEMIEKKDTIKGNVLLNCEGGTYLEADVKKISRVLTYVGAGYLTENTQDKAKSLLKESIDRGNDTMKRLLDEKRRLEDEIMKIRYSAEALRQ